MCGRAAIHPQRLFVSTPDALGAWVAESDRGIVEHVALQPKSSPAVMALACDATERSPDQLCVVARLFVAPSHRREGFDVAAHFGGAIRLYENAGWTRVGRVTVAVPDDEPQEELVNVGPAPSSAGR